VKRVLWISLGVVLTVVFVVARGKVMLHQLNRPTFGVELADSDEWVVVQRVASDGPADRAGVAVGDTLVHVDGELAGDAARATERMGWSAGSLRVLHLRGETERDAVVEAVRARESGRSLGGWLVEFYFQFVAIVAFFTGLLVYFSRSLLTRSMVFFLMMAGLGFSINMDMGAVPWWFLGLVNFISGPLVLLFGSFFLHFALLFPSRAPVLDRRPWLLRLIYMPLILLVFFSAFRLAGAADPTQLLPLPWPNLFVLFVVGMIIAGSAVLVRSSRLASDPNERKRLKILLFGIFAGLVPLLFILAVLYSVPGLQDRIPGGFIVPVAALIVVFPGSFLYAILRHRVFGLRFVLRRGVRYALLSFGATAVFSWLEIIVGIMIFVDLIRQGFRPGIVVALSVLLVWVLLNREYKIKARVFQDIDRRFYRDSYEALRRIGELAREVPAFAEPNALMSHVVTVLSASLHVPRVWAFCRFSSGVEITVGRSPDPIPSGISFSGVRPEGSQGRLAAHRQIDDRLEVSFGPVGWEESGRPSAGWAEGLWFSLSSRGEDRGSLVLGPKLSEEPYSREERNALATVVGQLAVALANAEMYDEVHAKRVVEEELRTARRIQQRFLPLAPPEVEGYDIAALNLPSREVGGDYYDFIPQPDGHLGFAVADVSGKGVPAALLMSQLQAALTGQVRHGREPREIVETVNRLLHDKVSSGSFATCFFARLDTERSLLTYVNAGHNPPCILRASDGTCEELTEGGLLLGAFPDAAYEQETVSIHSGDIFVAFTDGVTETAKRGAGDGEEYGESRLVERVASVGGLAAEEIVRNVSADVEAFGPRFDDLTLLVIKRL
jgi:sigma-B regulation protein RsbU (phosphoserine phosphatase)